MSLQNLLAYDFNMATAGFVILFALSGYLIPQSFAGAHALRDFILKRALRLYPTFLVAGVLALLLLPLSPGFHPTLRVLVKSFLLMRPITASAEFNHSHWVLTVILLFYALCLAAAAVRLLQRRGVVVALAFGLLALCGALTVIGSVYHRHFPILVLLGLAVAEYGLFVRLHQDGSGGGTAFMAITVAFWSALLLIVGFAWSPHWGLGEVWLGKAIAFAVGGVLFLYVVLPRRSGGRPIASLGDASYALYFFLPLFLTAAHLSIAPAGPGARLASAAGALVLSLAAAFVTFRLVGKPAVEFGHRLTVDGASGATALHPPSAA